MNSPPPRKPVKMPRAARGPRPQFFDDPSSDTLLSMNVALLTELMTTRERLDTLERLMERRQLVTREDIESFEADAAGQQERERLREDMAQRVFYLLLQQAERAKRE
ncbi:MAG: hypothetical protein R3E65_00020 [Steroidobacteraceae bacterium]